jgi:hypothetical protein
MALTGPRRAATAAVTTAFVLAATGPAQAATTVNVGEGTVSARGALVTLPVTIQCDADSPVSISNFRLNQRVGGGRVAEGQADDSIEFVCTGADLTVLLKILPFNGVAFKKGPATYRYVDCDASACVTHVGETRLR